MTRQRKPGGGRKPLSDEPKVKIEVFLPQSQKVALFAYAQMRSTQERREVTVSELIRNAIPDIISGISKHITQPVEREAAGKRGNYETDNQVFFSCRH